MIDCNSCIKTGTPLWNLFDQENNCENALFQSLIEEYTNISGYPIKYHISKTNMDNLFGEDATAKFLEPIETKLIYQPTEENSIIESFGFRGDDVLQYAMIPKTMFIKDIMTMFYTIHEPTILVGPFIGDVITTLWNKRNYEIIDIGSEERIFQGHKNIWELILRPFSFSNESESAREIHMEDNIDDITIVENDEDETNIQKEYPDIKFGDNSWVEDASDDIDSYSDVDSKIFGL